MTANEEGLKRSRLGRNSVIIAPIPVTLIVILLGALFVANKLTYDHNIKELVAILVASQFLVIGPLLHLIGLALGVTGLFTRNQKKLTATLGVVLNIVIPVLVVMGIIVWGFSTMDIQM